MGMARDLCIEKFGNKIRKNLFMAPISSSHFLGEARLILICTMIKCYLKEADLACLFVMIAITREYEYAVFIIKMQQLNIK